MNTYNFDPYNNTYYSTYPKENINLYRQQPNYNPNQSSSSPGIENNEYSNIYFSEKILSANLGKKVKIYMSFSDSIDWRDRIFEGTLEAWGKDFMLVKAADNKWYIVWNIYIDFIEFNEPVTF